jgi:hypothetical protein
MTLQPGDIISLQDNGPREVFFEDGSGSWKRENWYPGEIGVLIEPPQGRSSNLRVLFRGRVGLLVLYKRVVDAIEVISEAR